MAKKEDVGWRELCSWVEKEIFNYDENQKLQKKACLVLQGLTKGQNIANNHCQTYGNYSYDIILITFKANKSAILNGMRGKTFKSEENKMSYAAAVVRNKINDTYTRMQNAKKSQEKAESVNIDAVTYEGAEYQKQETKKKENKKLEDLW